MASAEHDGDPGKAGHKYIDRVEGGGILTPPDSTCYSARPTPVSRSDQHDHTDDEGATNRQGLRSPSPHGFLYRRHHSGLGRVLSTSDRFNTFEEFAQLRTNGLHDPNSWGRWSLYPGTPGFRKDFLRLCQGNGITECTVSLDDTIAAFVASELPQGDSLRNFVVLTGKVHQVWATTCEDYVTTTWPEISHQVMQVFDMVSKPPSALAAGREIRLGSAASADHIRLSLRPEVAAQPSNTKRLQLNILSRSSLVMRIIEAVSWLFAVVQQTESPAFSGVRLDLQPRLTGPGFALVHDDLTPVSMYESKWTSTCWKPLTPQTPIAVDFNVSQRNPVFKGMEVSFELLCCLCGVEYEIIEDEGLVLYGAKSVVFPVRIIDGCVEWHFQDREEDLPGLHDWPRKRLLVDDLERLRENKRHFLGLWADPEITLGTEAGGDSRYTWSQAPECRQQSTKEGRQIGGSISLPKTFTVNWTETYKIAWNRKNIYMSDFVGKLNSMINIPVILYCVSERRAWMVSFVSILLDLARARCNFLSALGYYIPPCASAADGGKAAFDLIMSCYRLPVRKVAHGEVLGDADDTPSIKDYLNDVWAALDCATRETYRTRKFLGTQIVGYEMADIAQMRPRLHMKEHRPGTAAGWTHLLDEARLLLFCEGLVDPIRANRNQLPQTACSRCSLPAIPRGFNIMTASLPCLIDMAQPFNGDGGLSKLTSTHRWHIPRPLENILGACDAESEGACNRLQELRANGCHPMSSSIYHNVMSYRKGAIIFRYRDDMDTICPRARRNRQPGNPALAPRQRVSPPAIYPPTSYPDATMALALATKPRNSSSGDSGYDTSTEWGLDTGGRETAITVAAPQELLMARQIQENGHHSHDHYPVPVFPRQSLELSEPRQRSRPPPAGAQPNPPARRRETPHPSGPLPRRVSNRHPPPQARRPKMRRRRSPELRDLLNLCVVM